MCVCVCVCVCVSVLTKIEAHFFLSQSRYKTQRVVHAIGGGGGGGGGGEIMNPRQSIFEWPFVIVVVVVVVVVVVLLHLSPGLLFHEALMDQTADSIA